MKAATFGNVTSSRFKIWTKKACLLISVTLCLLSIPLLYWIMENKIRFVLRTWDLFPATIFLVETSGASELGPRQACAVESAARHHRYSEVNILMFTSKPIDDLFGLSDFFSNIHIKPATPETIFFNTPLWNWYLKAKWNNTLLRTYDISDASRALLIWKHGGVYMDLDTVSLRSFYGNRNFLLRSSYGLICNGIFGFDSRHPFLSKYLEMFPKLYSEGTLGSGGPQLFTKIFASLCQRVILEGSYPRCNLTLLSKETAFPVPWPRWKDYFDERKTEEVLAKMNNSYLIHVWNYYSKKLYLSINSGSVYEKTMKKNCPVVYGHLVSSASLNSSFRF